jgi:hypothetical protein
VIIVTGTKRSGTSMWMRVLGAAGVPVIGDAFPGVWGETIRDANPGGFYECILRRGIYFATNPHPKTGDYLFPDQTKRHAVKVFVPGLIRSDMAFIDKVIASVRPWREYVTSINRLFAMEEAARAQRQKEALSSPARMPAALEWWVENFSLVSDALTRGFPMHMVAYESVLTDPGSLIPEALDWLGVDKIDEAVAVVDPQSQTQRSVAGDHPDPLVDRDEAQIFDEFYARVRDRQPLTGEFIDELNATNDRLAERIAEALLKVREDAERRRRERTERAKLQGQPEDSTRSAALEDHQDLLGEGL